MLAVVGVLLSASSKTAGAAYAARPSRAGQRADGVCGRSAGTEVHVDAGGAFRRLTLSAGSRVWVRFDNGDSSYRWSRPVSSRGSVARFAHLTRCPVGVMVGELVARRAGSSSLSASDTSKQPDPPGYLWSARVRVTRRAVAPPPVPGSAARLHAGGVLVYPNGLNEDGFSATFRVPRVHCAPGRGLRADVGLFGLIRARPPSTRTRPYFLGLTIRCRNAGGQAIYRVGENHDARLGRVYPGYQVSLNVNDTGGLANVSAPHSNGGRGALFGPSRGTRPVAVIGAQLSAPLAHQRDVEIDAVSVNDLPYRYVAHTGVTQRRGRQQLVTRLGAPNWYRIRLALS